MIAQKLYRTVCGAEILAVDNRPSCRPFQFFDLSGFGANFCRDAALFILVLVERPIGGDMPYVCDNSRLIGEQHVKDDLGWIPTVKDWLQRIEV